MPRTMDHGPELQRLLNEMAGESNVFHSSVSSDPDPTCDEPFVWWRWLGERHDLGEVLERLERSPLLPGLCPVRIERSVDGEGLLARWVFHTVVHGERCALPTRAFAPPPSPLLIDEFNRMPVRMGGLASMGAWPPSRSAGHTPVLHTQSLSDFFGEEDRLTPEEQRPCERTVTLDAWLIRHGWLDLLDGLVARSGGWSVERYQSALDGLRFLQQPRFWEASVQRWAEGAQLHLAVATVRPADAFTNGGPRRRL